VYKMITMDEINAQHQVLLELIQEAEENDAVSKVQEFLKQLAEAGSEVAEARQRSQLRGLMRFWSSFIYERTGQFPEVQLLPVSKIVTSPSRSEGDTGELIRLTRERAALSEEAEEESMRRLDTPVEQRTVVTTKQIGPYEIIDEIGEGGFSKVYKALNTATEELVALKVLQGKQFRQSQRLRERLIEREQLVAELEHPNIIPVYSVAEYDGLPCIAMKLVESGSLADRLAHWYWRPSFRKILEIAGQASTGLDYLHEKQIVHRDIKPANLLLSFDDQVFLTDFGIAQVLESAFGGMIVGTPEYIAPEAILHPDSVDGRADIYSLGVILFELFMGRPPFRDDSVTQLLHRQVNQPAPRMDDVACGEIAALIHRCLEKDPENRFQDAKALMSTIQHLLSSLPDTILEACPTHFITAPETRFTPHDTQALSDTSTPLYIAGSACPSCGTSNPPEAAFCNNCGASLSGMTVPPSSPSTPLPYQPPPSHEQSTLLVGEPQHLSHQAFLAILIVRSDSLTEDHFVIRQSRTVIGRGQFNDIVIDEPTVSRQHALLVYQKSEDEQGDFALYDLASANGTFVNEKKQCLKCKLKHNDVIMLGRVELLFKRLDDDL
jgi:serine/threonine protein kinase